MLKRLSTWWNFRTAVLASSPAHPVEPGERDIVVVPCWRRAEFLWHCLDNLTRNDDIGSVHVLFRVDTGFSQETLEIIQSFADRLASYEIELALASPFRRTKPSANLLFGILHAAVKSKQFVFLVEEDVMVARDFLRWHREAHSVAGGLFCSLASRNTNRRLTLPEALDGFYLSSGDYCSIGVCFDKNVLLELIASHFNMSYLRQPKKYIRRRFPESKIGLGFVEQDGLIRRIQERSAYPIAWPCVPRAFHSGFFGARGSWQNFNRSEGSERSLNERIQLLADTIYSADAMREVIDGPEFLELCMPCPLQLPAWNELHRIPVPVPVGKMSEQVARRLQE
jgi:hypothetical protein